MSFVGRIIFCLYSLSIMFIAILGALVGFNLIPENRVHDFINHLYPGQEMTPLILSLSFLLFLVSIWLFITLIRRDSSPRAVEQMTDFGDIIISLETIENLARKAALKMRGIEELKSKVQLTELGVSIFLKVMVDGEAPIPELIEQIQMRVKEQVETTAGIDVNKISVTVENIHKTSQKYVRRVE